MNFEINKTYKVIYKEKEKGHETNFIGVCTACFIDSAEFKTTSVSSRGSQETVKSDYFSMNFSEINPADFTTEFLGKLQENVESNRKSLEDAQKSLKEGKIYINNRSFLGKVSNFLNSL